MRNQFFILLFLISSFTVLHAQWVDGGRKQSQAMKGNGGLLVHEGTMYFWNEENHFQISTDNGATWSDPLDSIGGANPYVKKITAAGGRVYASLNFGTGNGVPIYSTDNGVTWLPDTLGAPGHALGWDGMPAVSDIYAWGHWVYVKWDQPAPYDIKTFGGSFQSNAFMNVGTNHPSSVIAKGDTLFAAGNKVYYTTDGGATFTVPANNGYSGYGGRLSVDGTRLYMFAYKAFGQPCYLYYSDDNAENWTEVDITSLTSKKIVNGDLYFPLASFIKGNRIEFAANQEAFNTPANVWKSTDLGTTWERDTAGLPTTFIASVVNFAYTPDGNLWCVRNQENIYKQKIDEGTGGNAVTTAPMLVSPQQGQVAMMPTMFVWDAVTNAASYQLQIASDTDFTSIISTESDQTLLRASSAKSVSTSILFDQSDILDTSLSVGSLAPAETYYWRVRGIAAGGNAGPWSATGSFTISTTDVTEHAEQLLSISPNPCDDRFTVQLPEGKYVRLELRDMLGRTITTASDLRNRQSISIDVRGLAAGSYWIVLNGAGGKTHVSGIVVK